MASTGTLITQEKAAEMVGVSLVTYSRWENGKEESDSAYVKVVKWINDYFSKHSVVITVDDLRGVGLVAKIRRQIDESLHPDVDPHHYARWSLGELFKDVGTCRMLKVNQAMKAELEELLPSLRGDIDKEDWVNLIKVRSAGRWAEEGWKFTDPGVLSERIYFKSTRLLKDHERKKIEQIVRSVVEEEQKKEKQERDKA